MRPRPCCSSARVRLCGVHSQHDFLTLPDFPDHHIDLIADCQQRGKCFYINVQLWLEFTENINASVSKRPLFYPPIWPWSNINSHDYVLIRGALFCNSLGTKYQQGTPLQWRSTFFFSLHETCVVLSHWKVKKTLTFLRYI